MDREFMTRSLCPAEQAVAEFYQKEWQKYHDKTKPFTMTRFTQLFNRHNTQNFYEIPKSSMQTYVSKILNQRMHLVKPLTDKYTGRKDGKGIRLWIDFKIDYWNTPLSRKLFPKIDQVDVTINLNRKVEQLFKRDGIKNTIPFGYRAKLTRELSTINKRIKYSHVNRAINLVLGDNHGLVEKPESKSVENRKRLERMDRYSFDSWIDLIQKSRMTHAAPVSEYAFNKAAARMIIRDHTRMPHGGAALLFGTQGPIMAPTVKSRKNYNYLCLCNLKIGEALDNTADIPLTNVVGNAIDPIKSERKFTLFESIDICKDWHNILDRVDESSLYYHVRHLAERHDLVKVVIMNSGSITGASMKRKGLQADFEKISKRLTQEYPHIYIMAMQMIHAGDSGKFGRFGIRYFHQDIDELIPT